MNNLATILPIELTSLKVKIDEELLANSYNDFLKLLIFSSEYGGPLFNSARSEELLNQLSDRITRLPVERLYLLTWAHRWLLRLERVWQEGKKQTIWNLHKHFLSGEYNKPTDLIIQIYYDPDPHRLLNNYLMANSDLTIIEEAVKSYAEAVANNYSEEVIAGRFDYLKQELSARLIHLLPFPTFTKEYRRQKSVLTKDGGHFKGKKRYEFTTLDHYLSEGLIEHKEIQLDFNHELSFMRNLYFNELKAINGYIFPLNVIKISETYLTKNEIQILLRAVLMEKVIAQECNSATSGVYFNDEIAWAVGHIKWPYEVLGKIRRFIRAAKKEGEKDGNRALGGASLNKLFMSFMGEKCGLNVRVNSTLRERMKWRLSKMEKEEREKMASGAIKRSKSCS